MMADFGIPCESRQKGQMLMKLNQWLLDRYQAGERAVLIVDEAQNLSPQMLEEIRLLTNLETSTEKLLQIVLAGQPELEFKLNQPELRQLRQRITLRAKTRQLTIEETHGYIQERMRIAGAENPDIFSPEAVAMVHRYARGIPRVTNLLCEHALVSSFVEQRNPVPADIVEEVARDFDLHIVDPLAQTPAPTPGLAYPPAGDGNGDQPPLIESLLQALNSLVDRLNQAESRPESRVESDTERKT
jgi:type II secretory pathway predicted ATPase ExeA